MGQRRIFIEKELCDGCMNCSLACMNAHRKDGQTSLYSLDLLNIENESRNFIQPDNNGGYAPIFCRHCDDPECVTTCMSGALQKNADTGLVMYDEARCGQCFMCVMNCPYGVPRPDALTHTHVIKCDFCTDAAESPSCVDACPKQALSVKTKDKNGWHDEKGGS